VHTERVCLGFGVLQSESEWKREQRYIYIYIWTKVICYIRIVLKCFFNILKKIKKIIFNNNILKQYIYIYILHKGGKKKKSQRAREKWVIFQCSVLDTHLYIHTCTTLQLQEFFRIVNTPQKFVS
jgi:hypothetical protein